MTETEKALYDKALAFATQKHKGQYRRGGAEYITHPVAVAEIVKEKGGDTDCILTALFHDLLEDTDAAPEEIEAIGGKKVLEAVKLLTKEPGYNMDDYISRIRSNRIALLVKGADRLHNLRCAVYADEAFRRRYIKETHRYYMELMPEIPEAVKELEKTIED